MTSASLSGIVRATLSLPTYELTGNKMEMSDKVALMAVGVPLGFMVLGTVVSMIWHKVKGN